MLWLCVQIPRSFVNNYYYSHDPPADLTNERNEQWATLMRYFTYFGLCVATCVIFKNSVYAASAIGLAVGVYISLAEYYLYMNPAKSTAGGGGGGAVNVGPNGMDLGPIEDLIAASQP